ncbi:MAG: RNA 2',3'-cyclic phosphodiesterase [Blastopirellula sp.]|nr:MAG: RNA 2',3'-cyclic phosphodiesterase [Blastopirellula sp.]
MKTSRCFVALSISDEAVRNVRKLMAELERAEVDVKWVEKENLHITLNFLGDLAPTETVAICRAVSRSTENLSPFDFELYEAGAFPKNSAPRSLWIGVGDGYEAVCELQQSITDELIAMGYPPDTRKKFHPHLTLGRVKRSTTQLDILADLLGEHAHSSAGIVPAMEVLIYASQLERNGPKYNIIGRSPLGG